MADERLYLSEEGDLKDVLAGGAEGFSEGVITKVLSYQVQAKVELLRLMESGLSRSTYSFNGVQGRSKYAALNSRDWNGRSPSYRRRYEAWLLYEEFLDIECGRKPKPMTDSMRAHAIPLIKRAEALLCVNKAMPILALRPTAAGGFSKNIGRVATGNELLSSSEMNSYRKQLYGQAKDLVEQALYNYGYEPVVPHTA